MSFKKTSRSEQFAQRRASLSTRLSSRGHGFEFSSYEDQSTALRAIRLLIQGLQRALIEAEAGTRREDARLQTNRLRGQLGNFRQMLLRRGAFQTADIFMTLARHTLPQDMFDAVLADVRWFRERATRELLPEIEAVLGDRQANSEGVSFNTKGARR